MVYDSSKYDYENYKNDFCPEWISTTVDATGLSGSIYCSSTSKPKKLTKREKEIREVENLDKMKKLLESQIRQMKGEIEVFDFRIADIKKKYKELCKKEDKAAIRVVDLDVEVSELEEKRKMLDNKYNRFEIMDTE